MWKRIRKLTAPPFFEDEDKTRKARMLNAILWAMLVILLILSPFLLAPVKDQETQAAFTSNVLTLAVALPVFIGLIVLMRYGYVQLANVIDESAQAAMQMVAGGQQQASGVEQIALAMQNINQATQQSLASTRQAEKAAQDLNDLAQSMSQIVEQYRL